MRKTTFWMLVAVVFFAVSGVGIAMDCPMMKSDKTSKMKSESGTDAAKTGMTCPMMMAGKCSMCPMLSAAKTDDSIMGKGANPANDIPFVDWWKSAAVAAKLCLTPEETEKLDNLFLETRKRMIDFKAEKAKARLDMEFLFEKKAFDRAAVSERFGKFQEAGNRLATEQFNFFVEIRDVLGLDRYHELKAHFRSGHKKMMMMGMKAQAAQTAATEEITDTDDGDEEDTTEAAEPAETEEQKSESVSSPYDHTSGTSESSGEGQTKHH